MNHYLQRSLTCLHRIEDGILVALLSIMIVLAFMQIVLRNGFDTGFTWADSLLRVMVLWIALIGAMVACRQRQHINIDVITRFLPTTVRRISQIITSLFAAVICLILAKYTFSFVQMEYQSPSMAFANIPTWVCESIMPICFVMMALRYLLYAVQDAFFTPVVKSE